MHFRRFIMAVTFLSLTAGCSFSGLVSGSEKNHKYPSESSIIKANNINIAYESYGARDREVILLIGGTGSQLIDWPFELVEELVKRGYCVVRFDNRDSGLSTKFDQAGLPNYEDMGTALEQGKPIPAPYRLEDMAADAIGVMDSLKISKAHIVGASMGGAIAQLIAIHYPERTLSLTSIMADSGNPNIPVFKDSDALAAIPPIPAEGDRDGFIEYQVKTFLALGSPGYPTSEEALRRQVQLGVERSYYPAGLIRQQYVALVGYIEGAVSRNPMLKEIKAPTVIVHGDRDLLVDMAFAHDLAGQIPGAELFIVKGLGHEIPVQLFSTFADAITRAEK